MFQSSTGPFLCHVAPMCEILKTVTADPVTLFNLLTPNVNYSGRTAPLNSKVAFYIFIRQI